MIKLHFKSMPAYARRQANFAWQCHKTQFTALRCHPETSISICPIISPTTVFTAYRVHWYLVQCPLNRIPALHGRIPDTIGGIHPGGFCKSKIPHGIT